MRFLYKVFGINEQDVLNQIFYKFLYRMRMFRQKEIPFMMVAPVESVTTALDINTTQDWRKIDNDYNKQIGLYMDPVASNEFLNEKYLNGEIISPDHFNYNIIDEPNPHHKQDGKIQPLIYTKY